jgi:hypothetical protein
MSQKGNGGTGWKFENSAGSKRIILFDSDLTFKYLDLVSWANVNQKESFKIATKKMGSKCSPFFKCKVN